MQRLHIDLHEEHFKLLEQMAADDYRDPKQQASWLVGCAVSGWAVLRQESAQGCPQALETHDARVTL